MSVHISRITLLLLLWLLLLFSLNYIDILLNHVLIFQNFKVDILKIINHRCNIHLPSIWVFTRGYQVGILKNKYRVNALNTTTN